MQDKHRVEATLRLIAEAEVPDGTLNLEARVIRQLAPRNPYREAPPARRPLRLRLLLSSALTVLVLLLAVGLLPGTSGRVSAQEILERTQQARQDPASVGLRSYHGMVTSRLDQASVDADGTITALDIDEEQWFLAPQSGRRDARWGSPQLGTRGTQSMRTNGLEAWVIYEGELEPGRPETTITRLHPSELQPNGAGTRAGFDITKAQGCDEWTGSPIQGYDVELLGEEQLLGRPVYVIVCTLRPGDGIPDYAEKTMKFWIDQEFYLTLAQESYTANGAPLLSWRFTSIELNVPLDPALFDYTPPPGAPVEDLWQADPEQ